MAEAIVRNNPGAITPSNESLKPVSTDKGSTSERQTPATGSKTNPTTSKTEKEPIKAANKPSAPPKSDTLTPTQLNKEVFSVLKELNENYKQPNTRIDQQMLGLNLCPGSWTQCKSTRIVKIMTLTIIVRAYMIIIVTILRTIPNVILMLLSQRQLKNRRRRRAPSLSPFLTKFRA